MKKETKSLLMLVSNLVFSIALPIFILNTDKLSLSPEVRLVIAILLPLLYGAYEWWRTRKHNFITLLGLINVIITGGFGLLQLGGLWFSLKDATFPALIGIFVLASGLRQSPFLAKMLMSPEVFNVEKLDSTIANLGRKTEFDQLLLRSNHFLALSFFISALLNFIIAQKTFAPIDQMLSPTERANILNAQIALMHQRAFLGIAIPSMVMMMGLLSYYFKQLERLTGEKIEAFFLQSEGKEEKPA